MARRSKARETALQMLYQQDMNPTMDYHTVREQIRERHPEEDLYEFAWFLFIGVMERRDLIDGRIETVAKNWSLKRMAPTDRNTLRMGAYEILFTSTPPRVAIDEALELAKKYGSAQSSLFVNGLLDRIIPEEKRQRGRPVAALPPEPPPPETLTPDLLPPEAQPLGPGESGSLDDISGTTSPGEDD